MATLTGFMLLTAACSQKINTKGTHCCVSVVTMVTLKLNNVTP